jgi:hypothetical protein
MARIARSAVWMSVAVCAVAASACGSDSASACDGATRGCVQLFSYNSASEVGVTVNGGDRVVIPPATALDPGTAWIRVDSTVGAQLNFHAWAGVYSRDTTCIVKTSTWTDPAKPPVVGVRSYPAPLASISCGNW